MKLFLIRHALSQNNVIQERLFTEMRNGKPTAEAWEEWLQSRDSDPLLAERGQREALALAQHWATLLPKDVRLYCSAMRRSLQTALPLAMELGATVHVRPDLEEVGGIYHNVDQSDRLKRSAAPAATAADLHLEFGSLDTQALPETGPWNKGQGFETDAEAHARAGRVAQWLRLLNSQTDHKNVVLVSHSHFLDMLLRALLNLGQTAGDKPDILFVLNNTSVTSVTLTPPSASTAESTTRLVSKVNWVNRTPHVSHL